MWIHVAIGSVITLFYTKLLFNQLSEHKTMKYEGTGDCGSTAVTDDLFIHSAFTRNTFKLNHIQVIKLNYKKK